MSIHPPIDRPPARPRPAPRTAPAAQAKPAKPKRQWASGFARFMAQRPTRPMALALLAAVVGLGVAGAGLIRPAQRDLTSVPAGNAALVNQEPILMSDFITETENAAGVPFAETTTAQRAMSLRKMIDEELMVQRSLALDLPEQDTDVRTALVDGVISQVNAGVLGAQHSDDELRAYYNANRGKYASTGSMTVTDLLLKVGGFENVEQSVSQAMADAQQAAYELRSGANLDYVKDHFGFVESGRVNGDELDFAAKLHLGPKLYPIAASMSDGQISEPIADTDGVHVMIMQHRRAPVFTDFEGVRNNVYVDYIAALEAQAQAENMKFLRANAEILLAPGQKE